MGRARHRERFTRARLAVCEDGTVPATKGLVKQRLAQVSIYVGLERVIVVRVVETELAQRRAGLVRRLQRRVPTGFDDHDLLLLLADLTLVERAAAYGDHDRRWRLGRRALLDGGDHGRGLRGSPELVHRPLPCVQQRPLVLGLHYEFTPHTTSQLGRVKREETRGEGGEATRVAPNCGRPPGLRDPAHAACARARARFIRNVLIIVYRGHASFRPRFMKTPA